MYSLKVKKREQGIKAKKLRKMGLVTGNIRVKGIEQNLLFTIPVSEARKLLKAKHKGGLVEIIYEDQTYVTLLREVLTNTLTKEFLELSFQAIENGDSVTSVAHIILKNKDKLATLVEVMHTEIPYKALAEHIVETIEIDLIHFKPGERVYVKDLPISKNENVKLLMDQDTAILQITTNAKA